ncbi:DivIVA domain-containing protein [Nostocoides sp. HKS02]|uniref:DivIVA domain-containing protein n=1 Tax=Nostocoides sp. HKS02 TaxID=1813880 RepID=UPI001E493010|nr:DivIVA domain-containing protein [Tetrasphaera sp. HKS02]
MIWVLFIAVAVLLLGGFAALITGRIGYDPLAEATTTQRDPGLPEDFHAVDLLGVHFDTALRGYRMDQVDAVLDRLQDRLAELESRPGTAPGAASSDPAR